MVFFRSSSKPTDLLDTIRIELAGRTHSTKSTLVDRAIEALFHRVLDSGIGFRMPNPKRVAELLQNLADQRKRLYRSGRSRTRTTRKVKWLVCEGSLILAKLQIRDCSGRILTRSEQVEGYLDEPTREHRQALPRADVIWQFVPCPPRHESNTDIDRFHYDLALTTSYIHDALDRRTTKKPLALAVVVPRIDVRYENAEHAQKYFAPDLRTVLEEQLRSLTSRDEITEAALFPVSPLGFGTTTGFSLDRIEEDLDSPTLGEREWLLKRNHAPDPYNVLPLLVWSVSAALRQGVVSETSNVREVVRVCRALSSDLGSLDGWYYSLKDA